MLRGRVKAVHRPSVPLVQGTRAQGTGMFILKNFEGGQDDESTRTMLRLALFSFRVIVGLVFACSVLARVWMERADQCWVAEALPG